MVLKKSAFASGFLPDEGIFLQTVGCYPLLWRGAQVNCQSGLEFIRFLSCFGLSGRRGAARSLNIRRSQADEAAQVLDGCHQQKFFRRTGQTAQFQTRESEVLLHMGKEHFDLLAQAS
jgi:hypothetical protein